jgi:uncharacterized phage protein gp47/JayE
MLLQSDLDLEALFNRIAQRWLELTGEAMPPASLEWAYLQVLVMVVSWSKIDTEKAISEVLTKYKAEIFALPYGAGNKDAIIALSKAYTDVKDVNVGDITTPLTVPVFLLAKTGTPTSTQISSLQSYLNSSRVKNTCDTFVVSAASQLNWTFQANISVSGDPLALKTATEQFVTNYGAEKLMLGAVIRVTDLTTGIRKIRGIVDVSVSNPIVNISTGASQFPKLGTVTVTTTIV